METTTFSVMELFNLGGIIMWPLLAFSVIVVAITIERAIFISYQNLKMDDISDIVTDLVKNDDYPGAVEYLSELTKQRMGARIIFTLLKYIKPINASTQKKNADNSLNLQRAEKAAETEAANCVNSLENGFNFLTALGSLAPLTGFLGTVTGMIGAFRSIAEATEVNAQIVANGIYEALITTVFGLIIAIIAMISHSIFSHIVDKFTSKVEGLCSDLITYMGDPQVNV